MKRRLISGVLALAVCLLALPALAQKKGKPPEVQLLEFTARRDQDEVIIDAKVRNSSDRAIKRVTMLIDFFAPGTKPVASGKGQAEPELLGAGEEGLFRMRIVAPARAVNVKLDFEDGDGRNLRVDRVGPFAID